MKIRSPSDTYEHIRYIITHKHRFNTPDKPQCMKIFKGGELIGYSRTN